MVDYIVNYLEDIETRRVTPAIEPGYLSHLIPDSPPQKSEPWENIMQDVEDKIMVGMTHWQHPRFHAYFPAGNSYPSILADMLSDAIGCVGFSWAAGPACTELETIVLDWLGKMIGLPVSFLSNSPGSQGGGVIQTSASECVLDCLLAARTQAIKTLKAECGDDKVEETTLLCKLMAYCSKEAHSCVEKGAMIGFVKLRILEPDENNELRGDILRAAMEEDRKNGMFPFFVCCTLGTTGCCAFDRLDEIGPICKEMGAWLHVDASYAGSAFICPEFRYLMKGIEYADSFNMNPNKWMLVNFDISTMWVRNRFKLTQALVVDPLYLQHSYSESAIDYRHWGIPLSRRFRSLKLWFVIRSYGVTGLQEYVRNHCRLAKLFETRVNEDARFKVMNDVKTGLVCFRVIGTNNVNKLLLSTINASGRLHMVPASMNDKFVIRFCVCAQNAIDDDIETAWKIIQEFAAKVMSCQEDDKEEEKERYDDIKNGLEKKSSKNLQQKRSFFVRMVSDPKLYNPHILQAELSQRSASEEKDQKSSWVSWPLLSVINAIEPIEEVNWRFRNWDTTLCLPSIDGSSSSSSRSSSVHKSPVHKRPEDHESPKKRQ